MQDWSYLDDDGQSETERTIAIRVIVEGSPEAVQRIADAIETAMPGLLAWKDHAFLRVLSDRLTVEGTALHPLGTIRRQ